MRGIANSKSEEGIRGAMSMTGRTPTGRVRAWVLRIGLAICGLIGAAGIASGIWSFMYFRNSAEFVVIQSGNMEVRWLRPTAMPWLRRSAPAGLRIGSAPRAFVFSLPSFERRAWQWRVRVPLWLPLIVFGAGTYLVPRFWRSRCGNLCRRCRYDLTGNVSGVCPECGSTLPDGHAPPTT